MCTSSPLQPGDLLVVGTDGIWEARTANGTFYGKERYERLVAEMHGRPLSEAGERLRRDILDFQGEDERLDDITAVMLSLTVSG